MDMSTIKWIENWPYYPTPPKKCAPYTVMVCGAQINYRGYYISEMLLLIKFVRLWPLSMLLESKARSIS